jgi:hypothetical protein
MKRFNIVLIILLSLTLSGLFFLRWKAREEPAVPVIEPILPASAATQVVSSYPTRNEPSAQPQPRSVIRKIIRLLRRK